MSLNLKIPCVQYLDSLLVPDPQLRPSIAQAVELFHSLLDKLITVDQVAWMSHNSRNALE